MRRYLRVRRVGGVGRQREAARVACAVWVDVHWSGETGLHKAVGTENTSV